MSERTIEDLLAGFDIEEIKAMIFSLIDQYFPVMEESEGVMNYKLSFRKAEIQFDPGQTNVDEIIAKIQKITRYKSITQIEPEPD